jgi:hypothetical protein
MKRAKRPNDKAVPRDRAFRVAKEVLKLLPGSTHDSIDRVAQLFRSRPDGPPSVMPPPGSSQPVLSAALELARLLPELKRDDRILILLNVDRAIKKARHVVGKRKCAICGQWISEASYGKHLRTRHHPHRQADKRKKVRPMLPTSISDDPLRCPKCRHIHLESPRPEISEFGRS